MTLYLLKISILIQFMLLNMPLALAQDTIFYYGSNHRSVNDVEDARFLKKVYNKSDRVTKIESFVNIEGDWKEAKTERIRYAKEGHYTVKIKTVTDFPKKIRRTFSRNHDGNFDFREYLDGALIRSGTTSRLMPLMLQDTVKEYYSNGQIKSVAYYEDNKLMGNRNWMQDGTPYFDDVFFSVDKAPEYMYGPEFFNNYILKNLEAHKVDLTQYNDQITLGWIITKDGELAGAHVLSGQYVGLGKLIISFLDDLPGNWKPARLDGKKVRYFMQFPINIDSDHMDGFNMVELRNGHLMWD